MNSCDAGWRYGSFYITYESIEETIVEKNKNRYGRESAMARYQIAIVAM